MHPRNGVLERLGVYIRGHLGSDLVSKRYIPFLKDGMHAANIDPVSSFEMTHCRILTRANHADHGLVIVVEDEVGGLCHQDAAIV